MSFISLTAVLLFAVNPWAIDQPVNQYRPLNNATLENPQYHFIDLTKP